MVNITQNSISKIELVQLNFCLFRQEFSLDLWIIDIADNFYRKSVSHKTDFIPFNDKRIVNLRSFFSRMILTQALT